MCGSFSMSRNFLLRQSIGLMVVCTAIMISHFADLAYAQPNGANQQRINQVAPRSGFLPPADCVAYYRLDLTVFGSTLTAASFLPITIQLGERAGLISQEFQPIFDGIAAASIAEVAPHTVCVLDFDGEYDSNAKNNFRITDLKAVLILESTTDHRTYLQSLSQMLSHYEQSREGGNQDNRSIVSRPNEIPIARFKPKDWPDWKAVEWASFPDGFIVGLGSGSIARWLQVEANQGNGNSFDSHIRAFSNSNANPSSRSTTPPDESTDRFLSLFVNLERLHAMMPEILAQGRPRRMLTTWKLDNARNWFLHGRRKERYLLFGLTWERRVDPLNEIHHRTLTLDHWLSDNLELPEPPGDFVAVIPMKFESAFDHILNAYRATLSPVKLGSFDARMKVYRQKNGTTFRALWSTLKPYLIVSNSPRPPIAVPGAATLYFELDGKNPNARFMQNRLESLLNIFMTSKDPKKLGESAVRYDRETRSYYLQLEKSGRLRIPSWGWVGNRFLIAGWGAPVITKSREWLDNRDSH